ncbi:hypothetical protein LTR13_002410 [Exophiala sideris]|nr:hypothetical protein LTR13_002410 [Exophiala sideris]
MPILITYATSRGSTKEVAERIASRLHTLGFAVDCRPVDHVFSVENYSAVIIGSPIYHQRWLLDAQKFVDVEAVGLRMKPVWAFSLGMVGKPGWRRERTIKKEKSNIEDVLVQKVPKVRDHRLFAGKDDGSSVSTPLRGLYRCLGGSFGDMRDWTAIDSWTNIIAKELHAEGI